MLNKELDPLNFRDDSETEAYGLEAFAYCYLAGYNTASIGDPTFQSFRAAYGPDRWDAFERNGNTRPACAIAEGNTQNPKRVLIAFEGAANNGVIRRLAIDNGTAQFMGQPGRVYSGFIAAEAQAWANIQTHSIITGLLGHSVTAITVAGFSLGGAVAELMARRLKMLAPQNPVTVIKFGIPKIGTSGFRAGAPRFETDTTVFVGNDPIESLPSYAPRTQSLFGGAGPVNRDPNTGCLVGSFQPTHYTLYGNRTSNAETERLLTPQQAIINLLGTITQTNHWWYHNRDVYRYALTCRAQNLPHNERLRFQYLDFPDNNTWGPNFTPTGGIVPAMLALQNPAPLPAELQFELPPAPPPAPGTVQPPLQVNEVRPDGLAPERGQYGPVRTHRQHVR